MVSPVRRIAMTNTDKDGVARLSGADGSTQWRPIRTPVPSPVILPPTLQLPLQLGELAKEYIYRLAEERV